MTFSWFVFFRDTAALPPLDPAALDGIVATLRLVPGLRQGLVLTPTPKETAHPFPDNERSPALTLQLQFDSIAMLEAAAAADGPLRGLTDVCEGRVVTQQAMLT